jgi:hypothetical protein
MAIDEIGLTVRQLLHQLAVLLSQADNALGNDPVVVRVDLGPEQTFAVQAVHVEYCEYNVRDPIVVIET